MWLYFIFLIAFSAAGSSYDAETPSSTVVVAIQNNSPLCQSCITIAGLVETYLSQVKSMVDIVCTALHIRETCQGMAAMLLGALKVGGEEHVCSMIGLCGGNGSLVDVSFILKPLTSKVESALGSLINITSDAKGLLGDSINQTSSGITNFIGGTKQIGENFKKTFSFFGRRKRSNVDKASANSGQEFDNIFEGELHSNLRAKQHWMPTSALKAAKKFLQQVETPLPENATNVEKALYYLTKGMKEETLKAVEKKIEKSSSAQG